MTKREIADALRMILLQGDSNPDYIDMLASLAAPVEVRKGQEIWGQGDWVWNIFIIVHGRTHSYFRSDEGKKYVFVENQVGSVLGLPQFIDRRRSEWGVVAQEDCVLLKLPFNDIEAIIGAEVHLGDVIRRMAAADLTSMVRRLVDKAKQLALLDVYGRIRELFNAFVVGEDGLLSSVSPVTQQDIADRIGSSREMVTRILKELVAGGYIGVDERRIIILKKLPVNF